jgi:hypothetical protein
MGKMERDKGNRVEREFVNWLKEHGIHAERVPLSGATRYQGRDHDVDIYPWGTGGRTLHGEVKARREGAGSTLLRRWLGERDFLVLHEDRESDLVVVPKSTWLALLKTIAEQRIALSEAITSTRPTRSARPDAATCERREAKRGANDEHSVGR